jgi:hypothetical protein
VSGILHRVNIWRVGFPDWAFGIRVWNEMYEIGVDKNSAG